jgi:hypothetical protein
MLGQEDTTWSSDQKSLLGQMAVAAESASAGSPDERHEVAEAIRKLHRVTLRQGVMRMLDHLYLSHLKADWDRLYGERSTLVHGLAPQPGTDYGDLLVEAIWCLGAASGMDQRADRLQLARRPTLAPAEKHLGLTL